MAPARLKLTPELQSRVVTAIAGGSYKVIAAAYAGISETTFYRWMEEGERARSGVKREFWEAIRLAEAQAEVRNVLLIEAAAPTDWRAAAWMLERQHYERWGRKEVSHHTGSVQLEGLGEIARQVAQAAREPGGSDS